MVLFRLINSIENNWSLKHVLNEHLHSLNLADYCIRIKFSKISSVLSAEELMNELSVGLILDVELSLLKVVELVVLFHLGGDALASEEPDSLDFEEFAIRLLSNNSVGEGVRSKFVLASLNKHVEEILSLEVFNIVLIIIALILDKVDSVTFGIIVLPESLHSLGSFLVTEIDEV